MLAAVCRMPRGFQHHVYAVVAWAPHECPLHRNHMEAASGIP